MSEIGTSQVSIENMVSREEQAGTGILKMIEDLEKDIRRIESKIAVLCGGQGRDKIREGRHLRCEQNFTAHGVHAQVENLVNIQLVVPKKEELSVPAKQKSNETATERDILLHTFEKELARINMLERKQKPGANIKALDDEGDWDAFIQERPGGQAAPSAKGNIQSKDVAYSNQTDNTSEWDVFVRERAGQYVATTQNEIVEEKTLLKDKAKNIVNTHLNDKAASDKTYDDEEWDEFVKERTGLATATGNAMGGTMLEYNYFWNNENDECDSWDQFVKQRAALKTFVDKESNRVNAIHSNKEEAAGLLEDVDGDGWDGFFTERCGMNDCQGKQPKKQGKLRKLIRRIFGKK